LLDFLIDKHSTNIINIPNDVINDAIICMSNIEAVNCLEWLHSKHFEGLKLIITEKTLSKCLSDAARKNNKKMLELVVQ
jgi:hypothetical protein